MRLVRHVRLWSQPLLPSPPPPRPAHPARPISAVAATLRQYRKVIECKQCDWPPLMCYQPCGRARRDSDGPVTPLHSHPGWVLPSTCTERFGPRNGLHSDPHASVKEGEGRKHGLKGRRVCRHFCMDGSACRWMLCGNVLFYSMKRRTAWKMNRTGGKVPFFLPFSLLS